MWVCGPPDCTVFGEKGWVLRKRGQERGVGSGSRKKGEPRAEVSNLSVLVGIDGILDTVWWA